MNEIYSNKKYVLKESDGDYHVGDRVIPKSVGVILDTYLFRDGKVYRVDNYSSYTPIAFDEAGCYLNFVELEPVHPDWEAAYRGEWHLDGAEIEVDHITTLVAGTTQWDVPREKELTVVDLVDGNRLLFYSGWGGVFSGLDEHDVVISTDGDEWVGKCLFVDGEREIDVNPFDNRYTGWYIEAEGIFDLDDNQVDDASVGWVESVMYDGKVM